MNLNSIFSFLAPKNNQFFDLFDKSAANLVELGKVLKEMMNSTSVENRNQLAHRIHELENVGDSFTHDIMVELSKNFITPFDREDIHSLASALDDIADYIDASAKRMLLYKIGRVSEPMQKLAELIEKAIIEVQAAVNGLRNLDNYTRIREALVKVNSLENHADDIYNNAIASLFDNEKDPITLIKYKEILGFLENATDKCEDASDVIQSIIIKNS
jgi:uncharacterized protein